MHLARFWIGRDEKTEDASLYSRDLSNNEIAAIVVTFAYSFRVVGVFERARLLVAQKIRSGETSHEPRLR